MAVAEPLAILHVASHSGVYRGGAVQLCRMAAEQARRGRRVAVVVNVRRSMKRDLRESQLAGWRGVAEAGVELHSIDLESWPGVWRLRRLAQSGNFDIVHAHRDQALLAAWRALWGLKRPALVAQRGTVNPAPPGMRRVFASPRVRAVIAVAEAVRKALIAHIGPAMAGKTHVVYGSVDLIRFAPRPADESLRKELNLPDGARIVGSLSAWRRDKGFEEILDALASALKREREIGDGKPIHAVFLGEGVKEKVEPMAFERGIAARCRFAGHQVDVARWLSVMDLTVVAAHKREGLSGVLRESLAMEIPVVTTNCAGNGEIVRDGETGLLTPVGDAAALEAAIARMLSNPEETKAMARAGRKWVEENCSLGAQAEKLEAIYRSLL